MGCAGLSAGASAFSPAPSKAAHPTEPPGDWDSPNRGDACAPAPASAPPPLAPRAGLRVPGPGASGERDHAGQGGICAPFIVPGSPLGPRVSTAPQQEGFTEQRGRGRGRASSAVNLSRKAHSARSAPAPHPTFLPSPPCPKRPTPRHPAPERKFLPFPMAEKKVWDLLVHWQRDGVFLLLGIFRSLLWSRLWPSVPGEVPAAAPAQGEQPSASAITRSPGCGDPAALRFGETV